MIFGSTETVKRLRGNPRVQVHGPGFSKVLLGDDEGGQLGKTHRSHRRQRNLKAAAVVSNCSGVWASRHTKKIARPWLSAWADRRPSADDPESGAGCVHRSRASAQTIHAQNSGKAAEPASRT